GLRLDIAAAAFEELPESPGKKAIVPGKLHNSEVYHRIFSDDPDVYMPPPEFKVSLTDYEKAVLVRWIEEGAVYKPHWGFIPPEQTEVPNIQLADFAENEIDHFIIKKLEEMEIKPSPRADKELMLRRLTFDLTGLPPSVEEIQDFLHDNSPNAYEKQVDRLMGSIHYSERMATDWMDVSRYSDTYGYQVDRYRDMSPWRDWVIQSFHNNRSYNEFLTWQLAGDLMPNANWEQKLATGFNRLHPQNMEGGIVDEEFRVENVSDRVAVLGDGLMGLTLSCAKCHDHKYDPISQKEYYELYSFFNNINETGQIAWDKTTPVPVLELPTSQQKITLDSLKKEVTKREKTLERVSSEEKAAIEKWISSEAYTQLGQRTPIRGAVAHYSLDMTLKNSLNPRQKPNMQREFSKKEVPNYIEGHKGNGLSLGGDAWLNCDDVGIFKRSDAFSIGLWVNLPESLEEGVIFHKNKGSALHSYRGYHLYLKDNKLEWVMARTWPENAIIEQTLEEVPREEWVHLMVSYDGSSTAAGSKLYINGREAQTEIIKDNLTRDIVFNYLEDIIYPEPIEPNLKIGARWRGVGLKGGKVDEIWVFNRVLSTLEIGKMAGVFNLPVSQTQVSDLDPSQREQLEEYYLTNLSPEYPTRLAALQKARKALVDSMEGVQEVMVMKEMEEPRKTYLLERGVYDAYGEEVFPNTPPSVMAMPEDLPKNRLGLAKWLTHPKHPLTARVAVNRYWQLFFGRGLVHTVQDFGNQGELPSHPELLDWLAVHFVKSGWNVKALHKLIVMSATYRQSSHTSEALRKKDLDNIWLARGPSIRLTSEMIRDNALAASGLLNRKVGGESVYPYQPDGLWAMNFDPYPEDTGENLYRRSLYSMWRRTIPNPTLATFDQPERNVCTVKRQKTNTPLQALVLMNDPTFIEASKVIGEYMTQEEDSEESIRLAFTQLTGKIPKEEEVRLLMELQAQEYEVFQAHPEKAQSWLATGAYQIDPQLDGNLVAANAVVASVIMNGDATITKR
ncbi:MAG: DUF1553 domain-containing protein, partial [Bacteroidota bacterium]